MEPHTPAENPYSSPSPEPITEQALGVVWNDDQVTLEFERTVDDYAVVESFRLQQNQNGVGGCAKVLLLGTGGAIVLLIALSLSKGTLDGVMVTVALVYFFLVVLILSKRGRIRIVRRALNRIVGRDAHEYLTPLKVTFNRDGFDCASQWERRLRPWSSIERLIEIGDHYLLVHGGVVTLVIPQRVFKTVEETQRFLEWIRRHVPIAGDSLGYQAPNES